ncbi:beta-N-acetylhexosaminidase [Psychrobacillus vulpis]|uniref:beta-N-acetylhexosaminidase n=2 Tax=Psychrobacillus vulpis TaxID=2325572 RepID=A0A544TWM3_9BACI|nr:beta-N-acetylhexosaminidase [Psychrobacillus vulpis]
MVIENNKEKKGVIHSEDSMMDLEKPSEVESLVMLIFELAKKGQTLDVPFIVGETNIQEVHELWGTPDKSSELTMATYEDYVSKSTAIGYRTNSVFDIRSNGVSVQQIYLNDIKTIKGKADEIRSYQDDEVNQIILVYNVTSTYQLKWVLPKPTENNPNPSVDHISVVTDVKTGIVQENPAISKMSLEEKIGQMIFAGIQGTDLSEETKRLISTDKVGGIIFFKDNLKEANQTVALLNVIKSESNKEKFPLFLGVDQEGGRITRLPGLSRLPTNEEIGKQNDPSYSYSIGAHLGEQLNAFGFNIDFAPVLDVNSNPKNPVIGDRSFGNNPNIVSELGIQTMQGIQSQNVISVVKHFPGHGDTAEDSHKELPVIRKSLEELNKLELIPFKNALEDGADVVMVAHILLPKIDPNFPSSMSHEIITGILREQMQFDGVIMTDDMTMNAILGNYKIDQAAVEAVKAGNDIVLIAHDYTNVKKTIEAIVRAVKDGEISEESINESVNRILSLKEKYNLANEKVDEVDLQQLNKDIEKLLRK